jgi:hypothetical protein
MWACSRLGIVLTAASVSVAAAAGDPAADEIASQFANQSLPVPTTRRVIVCHA